VDNTVSLSSIFYAYVARTPGAIRYEDSHRLGNDTMSFGILSTWPNSQLQHDPSKGRDVAAQLHGVTSQKNKIFSNTPARTSSLVRSW